MYHQTTHQFQSSPSSVTFQYVFTRKRSIYEVLGVDQTADEESVKRAYHQMALKHHPDRNKHDQNAEKNFKEIVDAYEILHNPDKRAMYDREMKCVTNPELTEAKLSRSPSALFDAVDNFFTKTGVVSPTLQGILSSCKRKVRGKNLRATLVVTFQESVYGCLKMAEVSRLLHCTFCKGTGDMNAIEDAQYGGAHVPHPSGQRRLCTNCSGTGRVHSSSALQIELPPGAKKGQEVLYEGQGDVGDVGAPAGDLVIIFDVQEHSLFKREGDDVIVEFTVSFAQASLGATVNIPSIYGQMDIGIPSGTQPHDVLRVSDQGFYNVKTKKRGNMLLKLNIKIPSSLTEEQKNLLRLFMLTENSDNDSEKENNSKNNNNTSNINYNSNINIHNSVI